MIYRQGDVLFMQVNETLEGQPQDRVNGRLIVAEGEATGHAHAVCDIDAQLLTMEVTGEVYLDAPNGATVEHEEHAAVVLPPGTFRVMYQREYSPQEIRRVLD